MPNSSSAEKEFLRSITEKLHRERDEVVAKIEDVQNGANPELAAGYRLLARDLGGAVATAEAFLEVVEEDDYKTN